LTNDYSKLNYRTQVAYFSLKIEDLGCIVILLGYNPEFGKRNKDMSSVAIQGGFRW